jgi:cytochrome P450
MSRALPVPVAPGRLPLLGHAGQLLHHPLEFLCSLRDLGPLVRVDIGTWPLYIATTPAAAHDVFVTQDRFFDKGRLFDRLRPVLGTGLITSNGTFHRDQRRRIQPAFSHERLAGYTDVMARRARDMAASWQHGQHVHLAEALQDLAFTTVAQVLFSAQAANDPRIARAMARVNDGIPLRALLPGWLTQVPMPFNRRYDKAINLLHSAILETIRHRTDTGPNEDLLTALAQPAPDGTRMTDTQIRDETITLMLAGSETTATVLSWTFHHLSQDPELAARVRREANTILGDRPARQDDLHKLVYTRQVLREAVRLHPVAIAMRRAHTQALVCGIDIPEGTEIAVSSYAIHRDPGIYPSPLSFDPGRWTEAGTANLPKGAYSPFSEGSRQCIGDRFAWNQMSIVTAEVLRQWNLAPAQGRPVREVPSIHPYPRDPVVIVSHAQQHGSRPALT